MIKLIRKHYMCILVITVFVSVFLYQFLCLIRIPVIQTYSLQDINFLKLLSYIAFAILSVSIIYNIPLLLVVELNQSIKLPKLRVLKTYQKYTIQYNSMNLITNRHKAYNVFRCWFIVLYLKFNKKLWKENKMKRKNKLTKTLFLCSLGSFSITLLLEFSQRYNQLLFILRHSTLFLGIAFLIAMVLSFFYYIYKSYFMKKGISLIFLNITT